MGLISGFLGGAGKATAEAGKMMFADKIAKEREEANFLRDSALKGGMAAEKREFTTSERESGQEFKAGESQKDRESREGIAAKKAKSGDKPTSQMKNAAALRKKGYPDHIADAAAHSSFEEIKDEDTGDMVLINTLTNKPVGRLTTVGNKKQWLPEGEEPEFAEVTAEHRKSAKKAAGEKAGFWRSDVTDFPSTEGDRKAWTKKEAQRLAQKERAAKKGGGIIGDKMLKAPGKAAQPKAAPSKAVEAVMADKSLLPQFIEHYGYDPTKQ